VPPRRISSYTRNAPRPVAGSLWVWKPESPYVVLTRVAEVRWNGEEWWVSTVALAEAAPRISSSILPARPIWNDLTVFWESCHYVAPQPGPQPYAVRRGPPREDETGTGE
jgi:hypothetical protein